MFVQRLMKFFLFLLLPLTVLSQKPAEKKYPSLLWEITGNGLKKPSYLFGTMHVSSKLAFHLPDSFYHALRSVDAVSLELNPDVWQGEMVRLDQLQLNYRRFSTPPTNEYINEGTFQLMDYQDELKTALSSEPTVLNGLLYRTYKTREDFEEDTFLDLYIFQTGKKLGKRATGVENYYETEKLVLEAYSDMAREKMKKTIDTDGESMYDIAQKTQDAYRRGDLDLLDSLDYMMERSIAFRNKFLYARNEIQANSIDTILKHSSLFVGVGAAHLAGPRGVIELLRKKGYTLRPVHMADRDATQKEQIDKLKVPVNFSVNSNDDGFYKVDVPGQLYKLATDISGLNRRQYADMSNGAYYMVTRIKTHSAFMGLREQDVVKKTDSLLYENIPGKIIKKTAITKNGYKGFDIINKTRRGDLQRYEIFVTPDEIIIFKMSGKETYVQGTEAERYFSSIQLKPVSGEWQTYEPSFGGFRIKFPQDPDAFLNASTEDGLSRWEYEAVDRSSGNAFLLLKKTINNFRFLEEDTFDLTLMAESFGASNFLEKEVSRKLSYLNGRPVLDVLFRAMDSSLVKARFLVNAAHYYVLAVREKNVPRLVGGVSGPAVQFFNSFELTPFKYSAPREFTDTFLRYTVSTPVMPDIDENMRSVIEKISDDLPTGFGGGGPESYWPKTKNSIFKNDSTGEMVGVSMQLYPRYYFIKDSATFWKEELNDYMSRNDMMIIKRDSFMLGGINAYSFTLADTNSSRRIQRLWILTKDRLFRIVSLGDSSLMRSAFVKEFMNSFKPMDHVIGSNVYAANMKQYFADLFSEDSATRSRARSVISNIYYRNQDIPDMLKAMRSLKYGEKDYFDSKSRLISELGYIKDSSASPLILSSLKDIYERTADTSTFQNRVLQALAKLRTAKSYALLKELLLLDPPVFESDYEYNTFFSDLEDSLPLTRMLFPEILQLSSIEDYKDNVNSLLASMIRRDLITARDFESYYTNIYFDARIELKKLQSRDEKRMESENNRDEGEKANYTESSSNAELEELSVLLMPFYDLKPPAKKFFDQLLLSRDPLVQMNAAILLLKNNKTVPTSVLNSLASSDKYRSRFYRDLEKAGIADKFPAAYKNQQDIARSMIVSAKTADFDSIAFIKKQLVTVKDKRGYVYFFKYRLKKDNDWKIALSGLQPDTPSLVNADQSLMRITDKKLKTDEPLDDQLNTQLKRALFSMRKSSRNFYTAGSTRFKTDQED